MLVMRKFEILFSASVENKEVRNTHSHNYKLTDIETLNEIQITLHITTICWVVKDQGVAT